MTRLLPRLLLAGLLVTSLAAPALSAGNFAETAKTDGVVLGFANEAPFAYSLPSGELAGVDYEILKTVLGKLGITQIKANLVEWGSLIPGLRAGRFDVIASGVYMKPERCEQVAFTEPLYQLGDGMIVAPGNPKNIHGFDAFVADRSLKLANTIGATGPGDNALKMGVLPEQIIEVPDPAAQIAAIKAGRADAGLNTGLQSGELAESSKDKSIERAIPFQQAVVNGKPSVGIAGIAFHPDNAAFVAEFDAELVEFRKSPEYLAILAKYKILPEDLPTAAMTRAAICKPAS